MCTERVAEFCSLRSVQKAKESIIILVSRGSPSALRKFRSESGFKGVILSDADGLVFDHLGARRSILATLLWKRPVVNGIGALLCCREALCKCKCPIPKVGNAGNPWQQGGCAIFRRKNTDVIECLYCLNETNPGWPRHDVELVETILDKH